MIKVIEGFLDKKEIIGEIYEECLDALFNRECYQYCYNAASRVAKQWNVGIGVIGVLGGGSAAVASFLSNLSVTWVGSIAAVAALILNSSKGSMKWDERAAFALERIQFFDNVCIRYGRLINDIAVVKQWDDIFDTTFKEIRDKSHPEKADPYFRNSLAPNTLEDIQREIVMHSQLFGAFSAWKNGG